MYDLVIRNAQVVDGTGAPAFAGEVAVKDGRIAALGPKVEGPARAEMDAGGKAVAPGFIDPHTHFDVQLLWDGAAKPSLEHGVTSIIPGNCSLSMAPLRAADRPAVIGMFQQIEELPPEARARHQDALARIILAVQDADGSWWDFPLYDYHQQYGTGFALMTLRRCRTSAR